MCRPDMVSLGCIVLEKLTLSRKLYVPGKFKKVIRTIKNFPFTYEVYISQLIQYSTCGVYISQLIQYSRAWSIYLSVDTIF